MKRKVCRKCKVFIDSTDSPINGCTHTETTTTYLGRVVIIHPEKSLIAEKLGVSVAAEYAIKTR